MKRPGFLLCAAFSLLTAQFMATAHPLDHWTWRYPVPTGGTLCGVSYGGGLFVAVGELGNILTSPDGIAWTTRQSGTSATLYGSGYGNGVFVAVGARGTILTSSNAVDWITRVSEAWQDLKAVAYGESGFVIVGDYGTILGSTDSISWELQPSVTFSPLYAVAWGNGCFVASGDGVLLRSSANTGWEWQEVLSGPETTSYVVFGDGRFLVYMYGLGLFNSVDGRLWVYQRETPFICGDALGDSALTFGPSGWVGLIGCGDSAMAAHSTEGADWGGIATTIDSGWVPHGLASGNGRYVAVGSASSIYSSDTGTNWTRRNTVTVIPLSRIAAGNGRVVAVGQSNAVAIVSNGIPQVVELPGQARDIAFGNGVFVVSIGPSTYSYSTTGIDWSMRSFPTNRYFARMEYVNGSFWALGSSSVLRSYDGLSWNHVSVGPSASSWSDIEFGNGVYVLLGSQKVATSTDGTSWNVSARDWSSQQLTFQNDFFLIANLSSSFLSADGISWETNAMPYIQNLGDLQHLSSGNGRILAGVSSWSSVFPWAYQGYLMSSADGVNWTHRSPEFYAIDSLYADGSFWVCGEHGIIQSQSLLGNPQIITQPQPQVVNAGGTARFSVVASGIPPFSYQWRREGTNIPGATNATLVISNLTVADAGYYSVVIINEVDQTASDPAFLSVNYSPEPVLDIATFAGVSLSGMPGRTYRLECAPQMGPTNQWTQLTNIVLPWSPYMWIDYESPHVPRRFYRATLMP